MIIPDGDYYASYANIRDLLNSQNIGVAGSSLMIAAGLEVALLTSQALINFEIYQDDTTTKVTGNYANICKAIQIDLVMMRILQSKHMTENDLTDAGAIQGYFRVMPALTFEHKFLLAQIRSKVLGTSYNWNIQTGERI